MQLALITIPATVGGIANGRAREATGACLQFSAISAACWHIISRNTLPSRARERARSRSVSSPRVRYLILAVFSRHARTPSNSRRHVRPSCRFLARIRRTHIHAHRCKYIPQPLRCIIAVPHFFFFSLFSSRYTAPLIRTLARRDKKFSLYQNHLCLRGVRKRNETDKKKTCIYTCTCIRFSRND